MRRLHDPTVGPIVGPIAGPIVGPTVGSCKRHIILIGITSLVLYSCYCFYYISDSGGSWGGGGGEVALFMD